VIFRRLKSLPETLKFLLTIFAHFPKLDVAGSNPVSGSMFSGTWEISSIPRYSVYSIKPGQLRLTGVPGAVFAAKRLRVS